ncbi:Keratin, type II cytoskeletal 8 [Plecturocebus cupreus]
MDNMSESYINNLPWQLDSLGQEKLKLEADFGNTQLHEEVIQELQFQISDSSVWLSMDNSRSLDTDGIIAEVKAQFEEIVNCSRAKADSTYQIKYEELQTLAGKNRDDLPHTKMEISEIKQNISRLQSETEDHKGQWASLEAAIVDAWGDVH